MENADMLKMLEQVSNIKKAFENSENKTQENSGENETDDADKLIKVMEIMQLLKASQNNQSEIQKENQNIENYKLHRTLNNETEGEVEREIETEGKFFDDDVITPELKTIKASIPFLDPKYQRGIGVFVKLIEIKRLIEMFSQQTMVIQKFHEQEREGHGSGDYRLGMLKAIKPHMIGDKKDKIEILIKFIEIKSLVDKLDESGDDDIYEVREIRNFE